MCADTEALLNFNSLAVTEEILADGAFLEYRSSPVEKGDKGTLAHANNTYWLVVLGWACFSEDGTPQPGDAVVRCVRAADGLDGSKPKDHGDGSGGVEEGAGHGKNVSASGNELSRWALVVAIGMVLLLVA